MLMGRNAGWRGDIDAEANIAGHFGAAQINAKLHLDEVRRAEFEPQHSLSLDIACTANALDNLRAFDAIHCALPLDSGVMVMEGKIASLREAAQPTLRFTAQQLPAAQLLEIARHATNRIPPDLTADGKLDGTFFYGPAETPTAGKNSRSSSGIKFWQGAATLPVLTLHVPGILDPLAMAEIHLHTADGTASGKGRHSMASYGAVLDPVTLALGGAAPATLDGVFHHNNYSLHLRGSVVESQLLALAHALPQLGDSIEDVLPAAAIKTTPPLPIFIDAIAQRTWSIPGMYPGSTPQNQAGEVWTATTQHKPHSR
jgi:AsmA protein